MFETLPLRGMNMPYRDNINESGRIILVTYSEELDYFICAPSKYAQSCIDILKNSCHLRATEYDQHKTLRGLIQSLSYKRNE